MSLSLRDKQSLYRSLGQLLRSGVPLTGALNSLALTSRGQERRLIQRLNKAIGAGKTVGEASAAERPDVSELEVGIISACEKSGRLEYGMTQLADYFGAFAAAREGMLKKCAYPAFILHFGILLSEIRTLVVGAGLGAYLQAILGKFILLYGIALVIYLTLPLLRDAGSKSAGVDGLLRWVPFVGKIRRAFSASRFCATYGMQLDAGINVINALEAADRASLSGLIHRAVRGAIPEVKNGSQVGPLLAASGSFPEAMTRGICIGEQTGELDQELARMTTEYREEAVARLETASAVLSKGIYICILIYVGYSVVKMYMGYISDVSKVLDGM